MAADTIDAIYSVELLCTEPAQISKPVLTRALQSTCPGIAPLDREGSSDLLAFVHTGHVVSYTGGQLPAQLFVHVGDRPGDTVHLEDALRQSWGEEDARSLAASAPHRVLVSDLMARGLPCRDRLRLFLDGLAGVLSVVPSCAAIHWRTSQQVRRPADFLAARAGREGHVLFAGPLNVRYFRISNGDFEDEALMDTMGLAVLGLPDVQCHFHGLEPEAVSGLLYNLGLYVFENGDVIESGHTVAGLHEGERWECQHEDALVGPEREVLDVNPGARFAAGGRAE